MASYNYGPPPPPPQAAQASHPGYGHPGAAYQQHPVARGGGPPVSRGRAGYSTGGRADYQPPAPHYEYSAQQYPAQHQVRYATAQPTSASYPPQQQWHPDHGHAPPQHTAHAPAPLSTTNYHPNYAPQTYPPTQHPQQPAYGPVQHQQPYGHHYAAPAPAPYNPPQQWSGHGHNPQPQYGGGRSRGGFGNDRGGSRASTIPPPVHMGYEHEGMQPQVSSGYSQPYPDPRAPVQYPPPQPYPAYHAPAPPPAVPVPQYDQYRAHDGHRGRGGYRGNSMRGRAPHRGADKMHHRRQGQHHDGGFQRHDAASSGKKKKRKTNTLGLTPGQDSDSDDDEKEEETLRKLIGEEVLQVADIASFIAERKKHFPTAARVKAKRAAEVANGNGDKYVSALEKEEKMASRLRRQLEKVESSIKRKREQQDEGDEMRDSSSPSDIKSEDDQPEVMSSRAQHLPAPPPPAKKADISRHCKYYSTGGTCGKKGKCRFVHDPAVREAAMKEREANNGQLTIQQRLILNDKDQEDLTVLQSIQYLREKGLMKQAEAMANSVNGHEATAQSNTAQPLSRPQATNSLPAAHSSLPPPPVKRDTGLPPHNPPPSALLGGGGGSTVRYQGWNLSGYGNSGLKSEDLP